MPKWIISYEPHTGLVNGFYPPDYHGVLPTENFVEMEQEQRDEIWGMMPAVYNGENFVPYVPISPTLDELKENKKREIIAARNVAIGEGTIWKGHTIYTDSDAQRLALSIIAAPVLAASIGDSASAVYPTWTCKDDFIVQLDKETAADLCLTIQTYVTEQYNKAAELLKKVQSVENEEELNTIVW